MTWKILLIDEKKSVDLVLNLFMHPVKVGRLSVPKVVVDFRTVTDSMSYRLVIGFPCTGIS